MAKYKKFQIKNFTIPDGKYIINSDKSITVQGLVIEMKSVPSKKKRKTSNNSKPPKWFKEFVDTRFDPFANETRQRFDNLVKKNNLKE